MSQLDAIAATRSVKNRLLDFCRSDHYVTDPQVDQICQSIWGSAPQNGGLAGDLWVEAAFPPRSCGETMKDHVDAGLISKGLAELLDRNQSFQMDWELREIQSESIKVARAKDESETKPAIVVSAGTGAGKTEAFLFPMLDDLMRHPRVLHQGASAIILYPMNALVTDQVERLTKWLQGQTNLKIFHFTGETPEDHRSANHNGYPEVADCCFRTRQEARGLETSKGKSLGESERGDQPDIIVTNYSMLEYMLCRPQDAVFFGKNLRHLVLDEAHLYTGNLAAEITMLLRRLAIKCGVDVSTITHYATSATLVEGEVSAQKEALARFAAQVFSKPETEVSVILGRKAEALVIEADVRDPVPCPGVLGTWPEFSGICEVDGSDQLVVSNDEAWKQWMEALKALIPELRSEWGDQKEICRFLYQKLPEQPIFQHLYRLLYETRIQPLDTLAAALWGETTESAREATRRLLQAGAMARAFATSSPLLPNRIHWSIRAPNGLFFSFAHEHAPSDDQVYRINGTPVGYFYSPGYFSRPEADTSFPLLVMRDGNRGEWLLAGIEQSGGLVVGEEALPKTRDRLLTLLERLSFFRLEGDHGFAGTQFTFDPANGKIGQGGVRLRKVDLSPREKESLKPMGSDSRLQLSIIAEGVLTEMPPFPGDSKRWKPADGRRLLIFSDSRSEAATLGPSLTSNHERQLFRALIVEGLWKLGEMDPRDLSKISELEKALEFVPEVAKGAIQKEIDDLTAARDAGMKGLSPAEFAQSLSSSSRLEEFFDRTVGERHTTSKWSQKMFEVNKAAVRETLKHRLSQELARKTQWPDLNLESAGLLELAYPGIETIQLPAEYLGALPNAELRKRLSESFTSFLGMVLDHVRDLGGITLGDDVTDAEYGIGGGYIGKWISLQSRFKNSLLPLITTRDQSILGDFTCLYLREAGMENPEPTAWKDFIENLFKALFEAKRLGRIDWLEFDKRQSGVNLTELAMRLCFTNLRIRRPLAFFQCEDSGQVWPRSALGYHLRSDRASLRCVDEDELVENPRIARVRREWSDSEIFKNGLWAEEHSAQIGAKENRRLQDLFKAGIRNILSSTTTLELGIDIGGLNGVMMGNIPPGKASYLQRAGRAGRRADGSSLVISYSRNTPYERKVFEDFGGYLGSPLREPMVFLDRVDIIRRHAHSLIFGDFFSLAYGKGRKRGAMEAFGGIGTFTNMPLTSYWVSGDPKPAPTVRDAHADLDDSFPWASDRASLSECFDRYLSAKSETIDEDLSAGIIELTRNTGFETVSGADLKSLFVALRSKVKSRIATWQEGYLRLLNQWSDIPNDSDATHRNLANALHYQLKQLYAMTLIESFSDCMILPRYGFPIGLSELKVNPGKVKRQKDVPYISEAYQLNRSASQAITEYAPGSRVLVGAKTVFSQGILKSWTGDDIPADGMGLRAWFQWDQRTGDFRYQFDRPDPNNGAAQNPISQMGELLFIKHGFSTAASEPPTYGGRRGRVGEVLTICRPPEDQSMITGFDHFFGITGVQSRLNVGGELLAMNSGEYGQGFAVCTKCGYARSEVVSNRGGNNTGRIGLPNGFDWHPPIHDTNSNSYCWKADEAFVLRRLHLAARQVCDFLEIQLPTVPGNTDDRRRIANTLCQALRLSGARLLNLDARELSILRPTSDPRAKISICDSLAGGAGHVRDLCRIAPKWWQAAVATIRTDNVIQATLGLLTADVPSRAGLPDICVRSTIAYLDVLERGGIFQNAIANDDDDDDEFDATEISKHLK